MRLWLLHPKWASRTCGSCMAWIYTAEGEIDTRAGQPMRRPKGTVLPCAICPKIPKNAPAKSPRYAEELDDRLWQTYQHYRECRAIRQFPDDPIVKRNAAIIRDVEDEAAALPMEKLFATLSILKR